MVATVEVVDHGNYQGFGRRQEVWETERKVRLLGADDGDDS